MFPIRDHNPSGRTAYVTYALIVANVAMFALTLAQTGSEAATVAFYRNWGLVPGSGPTTGYLTFMFLHGGFLHLAGNMLFLWVFGDNLEDEMGNLRFLAFYLAAGVASAIAQVAAEPASQTPIVGASGAIAGVMGGYLLMFPKARIDVLIIIVIFFRIVPIPAWLVLGVWFAIQLFWGASPPTADSGVAYWAHAGGFLAGIVLALPLWLRRGGPRFWNRTHGHPPHPEATYRLRTSSIPRVPRR